MVTNKVEMLYKTNSAILLGNLSQRNWWILMDFQQSDSNDCSTLKNFST